MTGSEEETSPAMSRRGFLRHAAWAGGAVVATVTGGVLTAEVVRGQPAPKTADFTFAQISDSHLGFEGRANRDVTSSFQQAIDAVNALPSRPDFVVHTGDITHFSTVGQFDQARQMMSGLRTGHVFTVPGEHDGIEDAGQAYLRVFGAGSRGGGWYSFDHRGVHFLALVNANTQDIMGHLGREQLAWVRSDLTGRSSETPVVVLAHVPLFELYGPWGWGTDDAPQLFSLLSRFGSVSVLNGHVHQIVSRVEGKVDFHTCAPTCYPLPRPGHGPAPDPVALPPGQLHTALGIRDIGYSAADRHTRLTDVVLPRP